MSDFNPSTHTRPYTVGFSIASLLIFLIALFHLWKFIFKKVKKWLNPNHKLEAVITEVPLPDHGDRKLSTDCIQQLDMVINYEDELSEITLKPKRVFCRSLSEDMGRKALERKKSIKRKRNSVAQPNFPQLSTKVEYLFSLVTVTNM